MIKEKLKNFGEKISEFSKKIIKKLDKPFTRKIGAWFSNHRYPIFAMLIAMGIMYIIYAILGVYPFGKNSILTLDMSAQYISYLEQMRDIFTGNGSLIYTFERAMGGEFLGIYDYYVASPLTLILIFFPSKSILESVALMMALKVGISSLSFYVYLDKTRENKDRIAFIMFSVMYAFCAYAMAYQSNTMWMDALMWLPLLTLGIERLVTHRQFKLFTVMLVLTVWSNYYIGYMMCFYVLFYFVCFISAHKVDEINASGEKKHLLKSLLRIAAFSALALVIASMVIFTAYYSLTFGKNDFQDTPIDFTFRFDFADFLLKFYPGSYDTVRPDGLPNVYAGMLMLFMLPLYFISKKVSARHKIAYGSLCALFVLCFSINAFDLVFHGLQMPVWLNYRYSFVLSFILLTMAYRGFEALSETDYKFVFQVGTCLLFALFVLQKIADFPRQDLDEGNNEILFTLEIFVFSAILIGAYLAVLYFRKKCRPKQVASFVLLGVVLFEAIVSGVINWGEEMNDVGSCSRKTYRYAIDKYEPCIDAVLENDTSFYRAEKSYLRKPNDNFALDLRGMSSSTSTLNAKVVAFSDHIGYSASSHWSKYFSGNEVADSLLGIKYVFSADANSVCSNYLPTTEENGITAYQNPYALPISYCVDNNLKNAVSSMPSDISYNEHILSYMVGKSNEKYFSRLPFTRVSTDAYSVDIESDGTLYMFIMTSRSNPPKITYRINGAEETSSYFDLENRRIKNLGTFTEGESVTVKFNTEDYNLSKSDILFVQLNKDVFEQDINYLKDGGLVIEDYSDTHFYGKINAKENQFVFTSIPYDKYWKVEVDGEKVETFETLDTLLAFDITPGEHTISIKYVQTPFILGSCLSAFGVLVFALLCVLERKRKTNTKSEENETHDSQTDENATVESENEIDSENAISEEKEVQGNSTLENNDEKEVNENDISR